MWGPAVARVAADLVATGRTELARRHRAGPRSLRRARPQPPGGRSDRPAVSAQRRRLRSCPERSGIIASAGLSSISNKPCPVVSCGRGRGSRGERPGPTGSRSGQGGPVADFFPDVQGPIPFGGLDSSDPFAFKVYQPDRLILGKRMEDHLRIGVCLWHSFSWPGTDVFGQGTFDRPWLEPGLEPMAAARDRLDAAFEFLAKLGRAVLLLPRSRRVARGPDLRRNAGQPRRGRGHDRRPHGADRAAPPVGHGQPLRPPALRGRRRHEPRSRGLCLRGGPGQVDARGDPPAGRRELRPVGRPGGLRHAPEHGPRARGGPARPLPATWSPSTSTGSASAARS